VTSAVRPIPAQWAKIRRLQICVSIDGLQPEHDVRRTPATYDRILKHIQGHQITVHCTVTRQQVQRDGYIEAFIQQWSDNPHVKTIWMSLYTPQIGEESDERLRPEDRERVVRELMGLRERFPKIQMPKGLLSAYLRPPDSPEDCIFAKTTECVSADLQTRITPCQFGGNPDCSSCGCIASAGLKAVGRHTLKGGLRVGAIFEASFKVGNVVRGIRERNSGTPSGAKPAVGGAA
jgi:sulfatase maturation enzyme AslB (radical SAM superfamily)